MTVVSKIKRKTGNIILVEKMRDYSNDRVFKKKAADATRFLTEHPLPVPGKKKVKK